MLFEGHLDAVFVAIGVSKGGTPQAKKRGGRGGRPPPMFALAVAKN